MSRWTHPQCTDCWVHLHSESTEDGLAIRRPARFITEGFDLQVCCFCGRYTTSNIFVREDPTVVICGGTHTEAAS